MAFMFDDLVVTAPTIADTITGARLTLLVGRETTEQQARSIALGLRKK